MYCIKCWIPTKQRNHCLSCYEKAHKSNDVQDMTNKDTPKHLRKIFNIWNIWNNSIQCWKCKQIIRSVHKHHYVKCKCWECAVDWWSHYTRIMWNKYKILSELFDDATTLMKYEEKKNWL